MWRRVPRLRSPSELDTPVAVKYLYSAADPSGHTPRPPRSSDASQCEAAEKVNVRVVTGASREAPVTYFGGVGVPKAP